MARLIDADKRIAEIKKIYCDGCDNYDALDAASVGLMMQYA